MKRFCALAVAVGCGLLTSVCAMADITYDTTGSWNGSSFISPFGQPNTATYGQTFVAPSVDNVLQSFTFYLEGNPGTTLQLQAQVYAWSGSLTGGNPTQGAIGPALYTSAPITVNGTGAYVPVTATTGGVALTSGDHYVALFTISGPNASDYGNSNGTVFWGDITTHVANDGGGGFNFDNNGSNYSSINNGAWDDFADFGDSAWKADFSAATPEPGAWILFGTLVICPLIALRRRYRAA